jgi:hypothetical protein
MVGDDALRLGRQSLGKGRLLSRGPGLRGDVLEEAGNVNVAITVKRGRVGDETSARAHLPDRLDGQGFFRMSNGVRTLYTRVGTFGLDSARNLVDQRSGFRALNRAGAPIQLDTEATFAPTATKRRMASWSRPSIASVTRYTSPTLHFPFSFCSTAVTVRFIR